VMAHAQKPDFVFRRNGRVHVNRRGRQFSRLLAAEVCPSAVVMLDTPCSEVVWVLATHSIRQFPFHLPSRLSPCAITFQLDSISGGLLWFLGFHRTLGAYCLLEQLLMSTESPCSLWLVSILCGWTVYTKCLCNCELEMTWKKIVDFSKVPSPKFTISINLLWVIVRYHLGKLFWTVLRYNLRRLWTVLGIISKRCGL